MRITRILVPIGAVIVAAIVVSTCMQAQMQPSLSEAGARSKISQTKNDMRTMSTALESYFVAKNQYPAHTVEPDDYINSKSLAEKGIPSLRRYKGVGAVSITTPVAYLTTTFDDLFAANETTFGYYSVKTERAAGWIIWSPGPDKKYDLDWKLYNPEVQQPSPELLKYVYDSTNGTVSSGDVIRVKEFRGGMIQVMQ